MNDQIKVMLFMIFVVGGTIVGLTTMLRVGYAFTNEADFYCYIPENLSIEREKNFLGWDTYSSSCVVTTANNTTLEISVWNGMEELIGHEGEYVIVTLMYGNSDDESGYARWVSGVEEQNGTELGYYPKGISYGRYYDRSPYNTWELLGLLGFIPFVLSIFLMRCRDE